MKRNFILVALVLALVIITCFAGYSDDSLISGKEFQRVFDSLDNDRMYQAKEEQERLESVKQALAQAYLETSGGTLKEHFLVTGSMQGLSHAEYYVHVVLDNVDHYFCFDLDKEACATTRLYLDDFEVWSTYTGMTSCPEFVFTQDIFSLKNPAV